MAAPDISIALVGNPNVGKTTFFNKLAGERAKVANYPGVTVERFESRFKINPNLSAKLIDLPGIYSLDGDSPDQKITADYLATSPPDFIINLCDATNLERNLLLTLQLLRLKIPTILVLTMLDSAEAKKIHIKKELLARDLNIPVIGINTKDPQAKERLLAELTEAIKSSKTHPITVVKQDLTSKATEIYNRSVVAPQTKTATTLLDNLTTHPYLGLIIFFGVMFLLFQGVFTLASPLQSIIEWFLTQITIICSNIIPSGVFLSLLTDGVIAGVGAVLVFVPQIAILFILLGLLEDSGYLARATFILDGILRRFGLQGRSFVPLLSSFGCAIPGIMATRTISSRADRLTTIMVAPLMSCSARLPVYTVVIGALFGTTFISGIALFIAYFSGLVVALIIAAIIRRFFITERASYMLMEIPPYRWPTWINIYNEVSLRVRSFIIQAGTFILGFSIILWALAYFPNGALESSLLAQAGKIVAPIFAPLDFDWMMTVAILSSFAAREVFVSTLSTLFNLSEAADQTTSLTEIFTAQLASGGITAGSLLTLLTFYIFACQCFSTLVIVRKETGSIKMPIYMFIYMSGLAYAMSYIVLQIWKTF